MTFYNQSLLAVKEGRRLLEELGVPTRRPNDFFCENVKTDTHMNRIKDRLLLEEKKMSAFDLRKQRETNRKFNKQVADLKKQEKNQQTKHQIAEVGKLAKGKGGSDSVDKFLNNKEPSQKGPKRLAMVNHENSQRMIFVTNASVNLMQGLLLSSLEKFLFMFILYVY